MRRGDVYWVAFDPSVGGEVRKTRPAILMTRDAAIKNLNRLVVVPTTSVRTDQLRSSEARVSFLGGTSKATADQITTVAKEKVRTRIGFVSKAEMSAVEDAVRHFLDL